MPNSQMFESFWDLWLVIRWVTVPDSVWLTGQWFKGKSWVEFQFTVPQGLHFGENFLIVHKMLRLWNWSVGVYSQNLLQSSKHAFKHYILADVAHGREKMQWAARHLTSSEPRQLLLSNVRGENIHGGQHAVQLNTPVVKLSFKDMLQSL